jgi:transcriptional regulator with PAS, ATPase and Fis domain
LFFRLNVIPLTIPPLRERKEDILELTFYFIKNLNKKYQMRKSISQDILEIFLNYSWPGNVRELANLIEYLFIVSSDMTINAHHLPPHLIAASFSSKHKAHSKLNLFLNNVERCILQSIIKEFKSIRSAAAYLGIDPSTLLRKKRKYNIN